jgi:hypothetical protein
MTIEDANIILARLEGFLKAFEWMNNKCDHYCSYEIHRLPNCESVQDALAAYFGQQPTDFSVTPIENIGPALRDLLERYLFLFRKPEGKVYGGDFLIDEKNVFQLMGKGGPSCLLDELEIVTNSLGVTDCWHVSPKMTCGPIDLFREGNFQDNVVIQIPNQLCLLHFGVSD